MATMNVSLPIFLDTNVLLRANIRSAPDHTKILTRLQQLAKQGAELWVSQQVLREYLATVTRQQTFMTPLPPPIAVRRIRYFRSRFKVAVDTPQVMDYLLQLAQEIPMAGKQIHDANIAATLLANGITQLITFNTADFVRFGKYLHIFTIDDV